jgi:hypothetical protein
VAGIVGDNGFCHEKTHSPRILDFEFLRHAWSFCRTWLFARRRDGTEGDP